jgi:hypothetical protein
MEHYSEGQIEMARKILENYTGPSIAPVALNQNTLESGVTPVLVSDTTTPKNVNNVTTLEDLRSYAKGSLVTLPDFADGQPFVAMLKRPSILQLAKSGKIPNKLLVAANTLFQKGGNSVDVDDDDMLKDLYDIMEIMCENALVSPMYSAFKEAGVELSDDQMMAIFNYTQVGVKALENFR